MADAGSGTNTPFTAPVPDASNPVRNSPSSVTLLILALEKAIETLSNSLISSAKGRAWVETLEAKPPPAELAHLQVDEPPPWSTAGAGLDRPWRAAIARLSDRVTVNPRRPLSIEDTEWKQLAVSRMGTLAVADVTVESTGEVVTVASMYGAWESPVKQTGSRWIYADASVHRLISDLSVLIGQQRGHKLIAAGDLNVLHGYGEEGSPYWRERYSTVFTRMKALGIPFVGPQAPGGGRQADPWPSELPEGSKNLPTYRTNAKDPETATRQLDFVFASESLKDRLSVRALNSESEWGPSDHCRIQIDLQNE